MISVLASSYFEFFTGDFLVFGIITSIVWGIQKKKDDDFTMIKEVTSLNHFDFLAKKWNSRENKFFWTQQACGKGRAFDPDSIQQNLKSFLSKRYKSQIQYLVLKYGHMKSSIPPLLVVFFLGNKNFMMNETMFEEVLWQMNGFYAKSIKQRKIMIKLLESAEAYAKSSGYKTISISRNPKLHNFTREKNSGINNYYTRNNYDPVAIQYFKTLN